MDEPYERAHDSSRNSASHDIFGRVPERFHQGRESLSVIRNVTIRESKRPKARSSDRDYQRKCSASSSVLWSVLDFQSSSAPPPGGNSGLSPAPHGRSDGGFPITPTSSGGRVWITFLCLSISKQDWFSNMRHLNRIAMFDGE